MVSSERRATDLADSSTERRERGNQRRRSRPRLRRGCSRPAPPVSPPTRRRAPGDREAAICPPRQPRSPSSIHEAATAGAAAAATLRDEVVGRCCCRRRRLPPGRRRWVGLPVSRKGSFRVGDDELVHQGTLRRISLRVLGFRTCNTSRSRTPHQTTVSIQEPAQPKNTTRNRIERRNQDQGCATAGFTHSPPM